MKNFLLWISLFLLIILLLLPPIFRKFGSDWYYEEKVKKDVVTVLNCVKGDETINTTYFNSNPYNFQYSISGNYTVSEDTESELIEEIKPIENQIIMDLRRYSMISYDEEQNKTIFQIVLSSVEVYQEGLRSYTKKPDEQLAYYNSLGFYCTKTDV